MGPGPSRNRGIKVSRGEYLSFVDPDDWTAPDFYENLYREATSFPYDMIKGVRAHIRESMVADTSRSKDLNRAVLDRERTGRQLFCIWKSEHQSAIYRSEFIKSNSICYGTSRNAQDVTFLLRACLKTERIKTVQSALYYYRDDRKDAATAGFSFLRSRNESDALLEQFGLLFPEDHAGDIPKGSDEYATKALLTFMSRYAIAQETETIDDKQISIIRDRFRRLLNMYPNAGVLLRQYPELSVMAEHGFAIPVYREIPDGHYKRRAERWIHYLSLQNHDKEDVSSACANAIDAYLNAYHHKDPHEDPPDDVDAYVNALLSSLEAPCRSRVLHALRVKGSLNE